MHALKDFKMSICKYEEIIYQFATYYYERYKTGKGYSKLLLGVIDKWENYK